MLMLVLMLLLILMPSPILITTVDITNAGAIVAVDDADCVMVNGQEAPFTTIAEPVADTPPVEKTLNNAVEPEFCISNRFAL